MTTEDAQWVQLVLNGDGDAFTTIVESYQTPVYNLCYRMLGNAMEAEDAAQETFWRAYRALNRYDPKRSFITWLLSIAAHYCIDQHRKRQLPTFAMELLPEGNIPFRSPGPEGLLMQSEDDRQVHAMLDTLNPKDRAAIVLRYWYDFSEVEISQALSLTVSAVKSRLHRARRTLANHWQGPVPQTVLKEAT